MDASGAESSAVRREPVVEIPALIRTRPDVMT